VADVDVSLSALDHSGNDPLRNAERGRHLADRESASPKLDVPEPPRSGAAFVRWIGPGITAVNESDDPLLLPAMEDMNIRAVVQPTPCADGASNMDGSGVCDPR